MTERIQDLGSDLGLIEYDKMFFMYVSREKT